MSLKQIVALRYKGIYKRCYEQDHDDYKNYGAIGIKMCPEWRDSYQTFLQWCIDNNLDATRNIYRKDKNGNYSPDNCFIANKDEYASVMGFKNYAYGNDRRLKAKKYHMPEHDIDIYVIADDAYVDRFRIQKFMNDSTSFYQKLANATTKLQKDNPFYNFKRPYSIQVSENEIIRNTKYIYNSDELKALEPYITDMTPEVFKLYHKLIDILEEWNEYTVVELKEDSGLTPIKMAEMPSAITNTQEGRRMLEQIASETERIEESEELKFAVTEVGDEKSQLLNMLMSMCSPEELELPLKDLQVISGHESEINRLKREIAIHEERIAFVKEKHNQRKGE